MKRNLIQRAIASILAPMSMALGAAMMRHAVPWATYAYNGGVVNGTSTGPAYTATGLSVVEVNFDMAVIAAERVTNNRTAITSTDVLKAVGVPAGIYVPVVAAQCTTVEGAAGTIDVGDGTDTDGFLDDFDLNATGRTASLVTTAFSVAVGGGKWYNADDTIDVLVNTASIDVAEFSLYVVMVDLRKTRGV